MKVSAEDEAGFLERFPGMRWVPGIPGTLSFEGELAFRAQMQGFPEVEDQYQIQMIVSGEGIEVPLVWETGGRIPRSIDFHVVEKTGQLCLGSHLKLRSMIGRSPNLVLFTEQCIVPYLYAASLRLRGAANYPWGELGHGDEGLLPEYEELTGVRGAKAVAKALRIAAWPRRELQDATCPCGCKRRLLRCTIWPKLRQLRIDVPNKEDLRMAAKRMEALPA